MWGAIVALEPLHTFSVLGARNSLVDGSKITVVQAGRKTSVRLYTRFVHSFVGEVAPMSLPRAFLLGVHM